MQAAWRNLITAIAGGFVLIFFNSAVEPYTPGGLLFFTETLLLIVYWFPAFSIKKELMSSLKKIKEAYRHDRQ